MSSCGLPLPSPLLVATDRSLCARPLESQVEALFAAGARWLWFRDKDLPAAERKQLAVRLGRIVTRHDGVLSIGGDVVLAAELRATAVHVSTPAEAAGARDALEGGALVGISAHSLHDVTGARDAGADYVTLSPVYPTASKPGYGPALGPEAISRASGLGLPVIALGGVTTTRLREVRQAGAAGVAVMGAAMSATDPERLVRDFFDEWRRDGVE